VTDKDLWTGLRRKIDSREAIVGIVGLGYVGLPVAVAFAGAGFRVLGVDGDAERVRSLLGSHSYINDVSDEDLGRLVSDGQLSVASSYDALAEADAILISVPTPITQGLPDVSAITGAGSSLAGVIKRGTLVILESTTYPGTTDELLMPLLESGGFKAGQDFLLAFSPERIDPGNPSFSFSDIPKIVGGIDAESTAMAELLYTQVVPKVVAVSGTREAEMAKLLENTFRHVNIALVNELAVYAHDWGIDIWESIEAAASKPFGFMPFWPGPGWGGHCIPLDPSYLSYKVRQEQAHEVRFIELAQKVNAEMPRYVVERIALLLNDVGRSIRGSRVLGVGIAYKGGTEDTRGSAGIKVLEMLAKRGAEISYHDPFVEQETIDGHKLASVALDPATLKAQDMVVALVPQSDVDWDAVATSASLILDCCNAFKRKGNAIHRL
jgi:nucleotide sugar dehydrogenase